MTFPPKPVTWATDANYDAGADPWSGTPTKVDPTTQSLTKGFVPETPGSAQQTNFVLNAFGEAGKAFSAKILGAWEITRTHPAPNNTSQILQRPWFNVRNRFWYTGSTGNNVYKTRNFGATWAAESSAGATSLAALHGAANNNPLSSKYGDMIAGSSGTTALVVHHFAFGTGWTTELTHGLTVAALYSIVHDAFNASWIFIATGPANAIRCVTCDDTTYTFTTRTLPGTPSTGGSSAREPLMHVSAAGVALFKSETGFLARSDDGGATWTAVAVSPDLVNSKALAFIEGRQEWVYIASDGTVQASIDGITWTQRATNNPFADLGGQVRFLTSIGAALLATWTDAVTDQGGMSFSMDGGATWSFCGGPLTRTTTGMGSIGVGDDSALVTVIPGVAQAYDGYSFLKNVGLVSYGSLL